MRQNLAGLNHDLIEMAQVFDGRTTAIIERDIASFELTGGHCRNHQHERQQPPPQAKSGRQRISPGCRTIVDALGKRIEKVSILCRSFSGTNPAAIMLCREGGCPVSPMISRCCMACTLPGRTFSIST